MSRLKGPTTGFLLFAVLLFSACEKAPDGPTSWRLSRPQVSWRDASGVGKTQPLLENSNQVLGAESALSFAEGDRDLALEADSICSNPNQGRFEAKTKTVTAAALSFARLLPLPLLAPDRDAQTWTCRFRLTAFHPSGSTHRFSIESQAIRVSLAELTKSDLQPTALSCLDWWVEQRAPTLLQTLAQAPKVQGIDTRTTTRRPHCSTIAETPTQRWVVETTYLRFPAPKLEATTTVTLANAGVEHFTNQAVLEWTLRSASPLSVTVAIPKVAIQARLIYMNHYTAPIKLPYKLESDDTLLTTKNGHYTLTLAPHGSATLRLKLNRQLHCIMVLSPLTVGSPGTELEFAL